ncbi:MAG: FIST N-terminal domain-containing protein [Chloroflexota bacterium]
MVGTGRSGASIAEGPLWEEALEQVLDGVRSTVPSSAPIDLALLFANAAYAQDFEALVRRARNETGATVLIGCSGAGVIGPSREIEGPPALSLLGLSLPGAELRGVRITQRDVQRWQEPADWHVGLDVAPVDVNAWLLFVDPFRTDASELVERLSAAYPGCPIIGGLASGNPHTRQTFVFLDDESYADGAVALAIGGAYTVHTIVSQGAEPIGESWTITDAEENRVKSIGMRRALDVLLETLRSLPPDDQRRAQQNLLVGLAMDEHRDAYGRGDFLIRNLVGVDQSSGVLAVGAHPQVGQTIQFQLRDARAAHEELRHLLEQARETLIQRPPLAAVVCSCNGRGAGLFDSPDHDATAIAETLGLPSAAGFFCNGEIGPVGPRHYLHGFTASIALIVPKP